MYHKLSRNVCITYVMILSLVFATFAPMQANAGVLNSLLNFIHPVSGILGNIGGAIAGASLGSGFCPPLGTIAGGIIGYVVGGHLASYATGGLSNVATLAGAACGYAALASSGVVGAVAGVFLGGLLGKIAYSLVKKIDNKVTGGFVLAPSVKEEVNVGTSATISDNTEVTLSDDIPVANNNAASAEIKSTADEVTMNAQDATLRYQAAYQKYINAARDGANKEEINAAYKEYTEAYNAYKKVTGK